MRGQAAANPLEIGLGEYHARTMETKNGAGRVVFFHSQVHRADQALLPTLAHSFVACGRESATRPCMSLIETGTPTHNMPHALTCTLPKESC